MIPSVEISEEHKDLIRKYTTAIACEMGVVGLMNMQYAICEGKVYVLEANPRGLPYRASGIQGLQHQHGKYRNKTDDL